MHRSSYQKPPDSDAKSFNKAATADVDAANSAINRTARGLVAQFGRVENKPFGSYRIVSGAADSNVKGKDGVETISERTYSTLKRTWNALQNGSGKVTFDPGLSRWQRQTLLEAFAYLLSLPSNRKSVVDAVWGGFPLLIGAGHGEYLPKEGKVTVPVYKDVVSNYSHGNGIEQMSIAAILGHELGHVDSDRRGVMWTRGQIPRSAELDNAEEEAVIMQWENPILAAEGKPPRINHRGSASLGLPLTPDEVNLILSIFFERGPIPASRAHIALRNKLLALSTNPDITDGGRNVSKWGAAHLEARYGFSEYRERFLEQNLREPHSAAAAYLYRLSFDEFSRELQRLSQPSWGELFARAFGQDPSEDSVWKSPALTKEVRTVLTFDLTEVVRGDYPAPN